MDLLQTKDVLMSNYGERPLVIVRGEGPFLYDDKGRRYLDFTAGIAVCNLGHAHPGVAQILADQSRTLIHTSNLFLVPGQVKLAQKLLENTSFSDDARVMFVNSGTEANEAALKLARRYQSVTAGNSDKHHILSLPGGFHGRTMGSLSATPKRAYHEGFTPLVPGFDTPDTLDVLLEHIDEHTAACIVEVVQGEAGVYPLEASFLQALQQKLHEFGALLIVDEIQTGVGRTGTFFAYEQVGIQPDIVTMAKGLGNGVPVGAVIASASVAAAFTPGTHGTTFGGNPLAMAVANYVVDQVLEPTFLANVRVQGERVEGVLRNRFGNVSGRGLMWGFDVDDADVFVRDAKELGLLVTKCGTKRIRIVPPLIIQEEHVSLFSSIVRQL